MQQTPRCGLLICRGQEKSSEETAQQQFSSFYSGQFQFKKKNLIEKVEKGSHNSKEIFSFKLNNFRDYRQSDKNHINSSRHLQNLKEAPYILQNCKSSQRKPNNIARSQFVNSPQHCRYYCSPPTKTQISPTFTFQKTSVVFTSPPKNISEPKIAFTIANNKAYGSEANEIKSKKSQQTQYSSKQSEVWHRSEQRRDVLQNIQPLSYQRKVHFQENSQQQINKNKKMSETKTSNLGNETERTLIDSLNDEFYKTKQSTKINQGAFQHSPLLNKNLSNNSKQQIKGLSFKNHHQTIKLSSPVKAKIIKGPSEYGYGLSGINEQESRGLMQRTFVKIA